MAASTRREGRGQARRTADRQVGGPEWFWSVRGDIETFTEVIKTYLRESGRAGSPIVLVGESYGGFRAPLIADSLMRDHGIGVSALVLVSPVLDFDARRGNNLPMHYVNLLPSLAATRLEREGNELSRAVLAPAESYARGEFLTDLVRGARDEAGRGRVTTGVAALTGLPAESVRAMSGRISARTFVRSSPLFGRENVSLYDAGMAGLGAREGRPSRGGGDAFTTGLSQPLTEAMTHLHARLGWVSARPYVLLSHEVGNAWIWRNSPYPPQALDALQNLLQADQRRRVMVAHGFTDLVTPYLASAIQLDQLPLHGVANGGGDRIHFEVYPGGHMFYSRDGSRARFRADGARAVGSAVQPLPSTTSGHRETP